MLLLLIIEMKQNIQQIKNDEIKNILSGKVDIIEKTAKTLCKLL